MNDNTATESDVNAFLDIEIPISVRFGSAKRKLKDIFNLDDLAVVIFNECPGEPVQLVANGKLIAEGDVMILDECFAFRVTKVMKS